MVEIGHLHYGHIGWTCPDCGWVCTTDMQCQSCGAVFTHEVRYHSGSRECGECWDWRKITGPAARYWVKAIETLQEQGPDMADVMQWEQWGMLESATKAFYTLRALHQAYAQMIEDEKARRAR